MKTFREMAESIQKLSDEKIDDYVSKHIKNNVMTFEYNSAAVTELGRVLPDVLVTKDKKYFHINGDQTPKEQQSVKIIINKYNLKEVK